MDPLATVTDLQGRLRRTLTTDEQTQAGLLLVDASAAVRGYTRQQITAATSTDLCRLYGGTMEQEGVWYPAVVRLPQRPVTAVSVVVDLDGDPVEFAWDGGQLVGVRKAPVRVTYVHGWAADDPVMDIVKAIVCAAAARALGRDPEDGAVQQETIAGYSYTVGAVGAAGAVGLLPAEQAALSSIRGRKARAIGLYG